MNLSNYFKTRYPSLYHAVITDKELCEKIVSPELIALNKKAVAFLKESEKEFSTPNKELNQRYAIHYVWHKLHAFMGMPVSAPRNLASYIQTRYPNVSAVFNSLSKKEHHKLFNSDDAVALAEDLPLNSTAQNFLENSEAYLYSAEYTFENNKKYVAFMQAQARYIFDMLTLIIYG